MALDHAQLERLLCERLCANVRVHRRHDDVLMLESPFTFPDGDHYPIYLSETPGGGVKLSDRGHTLMHVSYEHDVDSFYEGARASLREQIVRESGIDDADYIPPDISNATAYPVDYYFPGSDERPVFLYGVPGRDKARLTTIMLSHFLLHGLTFESVIVFADQQEIPRLYLARLTNVAGTAVASLDAERDLRRKIERLAA